MEIITSIYTDLIFHIFAHMKVDNASDIYDEAYIEYIERKLGKITVIPESMVRYYCENFERLAFINFLPYFMVKSPYELIYMITHTGMTTAEDNAEFINPFCNIIRDISEDYINYRKQESNGQKALLLDLEEFFVKHINVMQPFFKEHENATNMTPMVIISESLRINGRATGMGDKFIVILPMPDGQHSLKDIYMQFVHECTHPLTDSLLDSIRMDDGSHDLAEYLVMLYDLWLFQNYDEELLKDYTDWISGEALKECECNLSTEQKKKLKALFEAF